MLNTGDKANLSTKHVQTHIKNDKLPLSLLRSSSGRPKLSTRGLALHRQTAISQSSATEQEQQDLDSTSISSPQQPVPGSPLGNPAQKGSDIFAIANHRYENLRASPDGPALPATTSTASTTYNSMPRVGQSSIIGTSELNAPQNVAGFNSVEAMRISTAPVEATHDYRETHSLDARTLSFPPLPSRGYEPLHSPPNLGPARLREATGYLVRDRLAKVANELIHE